jgi:hypothetical protein
MTVRFFGETGPIEVPRRRVEESRTDAAVKSAASTPPAGNRLSGARARSSVVDHGRDRPRWEIS